MRTLILILAALAPVWAQKPPVIRQVRSAVDQKDFARAAAALEEYKKTSGASAGWLEAYSWMARGYLNAKEYDKADKYAAETREMSLAMLKSRGLDDEPSLPIALGASIEVQAQVMNARGQKTEAVAFLTTEVKRWHETSIRTRIQKNLHLISLAGKPAPPLEVKEYLGAKPQSLAQLKGKTVLLFFWAHWCGDCKANAEAIARLAREFKSKGLVVMGPTQTYGYAAGGAEVPRAEELKYIDVLRQKFYSSIEGMTVPVSEENFKNWGSSTTPTLALIDRRGIVRMYHPGQMKYEELVKALGNLGVT